MLPPDWPLLPPDEPRDAPPDDPVVDCPPDWLPPCWLLPDDAPDRSLPPLVEERVVVDVPVVVSRERTLPRTLISLDGRRLIVVRLDSPWMATPGRRWRRITVLLSGSLAT
jgi:hypothetical protein